MPDTDLRREDEIDQRANDMFAQHPDLQEREQNAGKSVGDEAEDYLRNNTSGSKNPWTGKETNNSTDNIGAIKDKETSPGWQQNFTGKGANKSTGFTMSNLKKKGTAGAIIALLLGGGVIGTSLLSPALLLVHMKNTLMNDLSDATPAQTMRSDYVMRNKIKGLGVKAGVCTSAVSIRCKFSTMSNRQVKKFEKAGFKFEDKGKTTLQKISGRNSFTSMTFDHPDGTTTKISNPQEMKAFARTPEGRAALFKAFNPKTAYFLNGDFSNMLRTKLGLSKESKIKPGSEEETKKSFNDSVGADEETKNQRGGRFSTAADDAEAAESEVKSKAAGMGAVSGEVACVAYNSSRRIITAVKVAKAAAFAAFALTFLTETDKLIAGNADPSVVSQLGNQLTSTDNRKEVDGKANPNYQKSSTDSAGYRLAAYNDTSNTNNSHYSLGGGSILGILSAIVGLPKLLDGKVPGLTGRMAVKALCTLLQYGGIAALLKCVVDVFADGGAGCIAQAAIGISIGVVATIAMGKVVDYLINNLGKMSLDASTFGPDVGDAYFAGASTILSDTAASSGMMPADKSSLKSYFANTDPIRKQTIAAETYMAQATPFDVYNQYSFLGSIAQPINATLLSQTTFASKVAGLFNLIPSSFASIGKVGAAYNEQQKPYSDARFSQCNDPDLSEIGVDGDEFCNIRYTMSSAELNMNPDDNIQYMVNGGYVDENTGDARSDTDAGKIYQKFLDNCVNRTEPMGSTEKPIESADDWDSGKNCGVNPNTNDVSKEQLSNFRVFTIDMQTEDAMDEDPSASSGGTAPSDTTSSGDLIGAPENVDSVGKGWQLKDNTDYSNIPCAAGTTEDGTNTNQGNGTTVRVCILKGKKIASAISAEAVKMFTAAQKDGVNITITSGLRTYAEQVALRNQNCGGSMTIPAEQCSPPTAIPGQSNHEKGTAMDLNATGDNNVSDWLKKNAVTYGFYNLPSESWHWSTSGM